MHVKTPPESRGPVHDAPDSLLQTYSSDKSKHRSLSLSRVKPQNATC
jgi:hypothetical protein